MKNILQKFECLIERSEIKKGYNEFKVEDSAFILIVSFNYPGLCNLKTEFYIQKTLEYIICDASDVLHILAILFKKKEKETGKNFNFTLST